jgi:hypothetical protein
MITTFQESSCGTMEMARPVGHSQMSSISSLIADSSSSRVFVGFFKLVFHRAERDHRLWLSARAHCFATSAVLNRRAVVNELKALPG